MNTPGHSRASSYFDSSSSRPAKHGAKAFLGGTALLLSLLVLGSSAFGQTTLTPPTLSFGNQAVHVASVPKTATLKNKQAGPLRISSIVITGGSAPADYAWGGNCPINPNTLGAGVSCSISVTFRPSALGSRTASLTVTDSASTSPQSTTLTGIGVAVENSPVTVSPTSLTFASRLVGTTSSAQIVTLTNDLNTELAFSSAAASGDFDVAGNSCSSRLVGPGLKCAVGVTFTPKALGLRQGTLTINYSALGGPSRVGLSGTGNDTGLAITITDLPTGALANVTVTDPNGQQRVVTSSQIISAIPGRYTITAAPVVVGTNTYHATQTTQKVTVASGSTSRVTVDYYNIVPNTTKVLDQTGAQSLTVSSDGSTLTISSASPVANSLQPGDVLAIAPVTAAPNGLLVKVVAATVTGSTVTVVTTPATLAEEVTQAQFGVDIPFVLRSTSAASRTHAGYEIRTNQSAGPQTGSLTNPCAGAGKSLSLPFSYSLPPDPNQDTLTASGELDFCNLHVDFEIHPLSTYAKATATLQQYSNLVVQGQYSISFDWNEPLDLSQLLNQVVCLGNETCQAVLGLGDSVGNALEVVTPSITPFVGMTGSASGGLYLGGAETGSFQAGVQIQGVTPSPIYSGTLHQASFPTAVGGALDVKGYFGVTLGFQLLGSVTFHADPRAYAQLKADTAANPWWTLSLGDEADAGMTLSFLGFGSSEHDTPEYTIYSGQVAQASGPYAGQPTLASLTPDTATQGSSALTLSLAGTNFVPGCYVTFNGSRLSTTYSDPTSLTAQVPASFFASAGLYSVAVTNSNVTGTTSNALSFTVAAPVPAITKLNPASLPVGSAPQTLTINGTGFLATSTVTFSRIAHAAAFVSARQLTISLTPSDLATAGTFPVVVTNPAPGGGASNSAVFTVSAPVSGVIVSPSSVSVPEGAVQTFTATVSGGGGVTWSVQEGAAGGTITTAGIYTAPSSTGTFHVVAANSANSTQTATATVTVIAALSYSILYSFPSAFETASLVEVKGSFYGTNEMVAFKIDASGAFTQLAWLSSSPDGPISPLILASDENFYGTTSVEGDDGLGSIFRMDASGKVTNLYSFAYDYLGDLTGGAWPWAGLIQGSDGYFYGTTYAGGNISCTPNGYGVPAYGPYGLGVGWIYGTGCGTVFRMDSTGNVTVLYSFSGQADGSFPQAPLIQGSDGNFYGTTSAGGAYGYGTVFKMEVSGNSGSVLVLHSFSGADGNGPVAGLLQAADGNLYGTTIGGGASSGGEVFKVDTAGEIFRILHSFSGADGEGPVAPLIQGSDGSFYGTTWGGGDPTCGPPYDTYGYPYWQPDCGTVFKMDSAGNVTVLHAFEEPPSDGAAPYAGLLFGRDGNLYGTTYFGGTWVSFGTVFRLSVPDSP